MTNHWTDLENARTIMVIGANPAENHPASWGKINAARAAGAKMICADPRLTRTAAASDLFLRMRCGSNGAFMMGLINYIITNNLFDATYVGGKISTRSFFGTNSIGGAREKPTLTSTNATQSGSLIGGWPKWTDACFKLNAGRTDYERADVTMHQTTTLSGAVSSGASAITVPILTNFVAGKTITIGTGTTEVATISATSGTAAPFTITLTAPLTNGYSVGEAVVRNSDVVITQMPVVLSDWATNPDSVFSVLKARAAHYTPAVVADVCALVGGAAAFNNFAAMVADSRGDDATTGGTGPLKGNKFPGTILYAMGGTQSTHAAQDLRAYGMLQMLLGNMGRAGGGVNALRGIHNVQGSTDMGVLYSSMPGYSDVAPTTGSGSTYTQYMDKLFGNEKNTLTGNGTTVSYWSGIQQIGYRNMIWHWFRQGTTPITAEYTANDNSNFDLLPKGNGLYHIEMFQKSAESYTTPADKVKCMYILGQNPAVTEPNTTMINLGLYGLDTLVVTDMFESETAGCSRKATGVTYLLPSCAFAEEEGSVSNSGRWIQWRYKALNPQGKTKDDTEILLTIAKKLDVAGAFSHIPLSGAFTNRYDQLYGSQYGWTPATPDSSDFNTGATCATVAESIFKQIASDDTAGNAIKVASTTGFTTGTVVINAGQANEETKTISSFTASPGFITFSNALVYAHAAGEPVVGTSGGSTTLSAPLDYGALWIYRGAWWSQTIATWGLATNDPNPLLAWTTTNNRAKSRCTVDHFNAKLMYPAWGWSWLHNRRVMYNNGAYSGDQGDNFVAPDLVARFYCHGSLDASPTPVAYAGSYRAYSKLNDPNGGDGSTCVAAEQARMPKHWEPHETPNTAAMAKYGKTGTNATGAIGAVADYPLILTTIRVTEHYQGGVMTRNTPYLCELVNEPFIDINSYDAYKLGISDGEAVYIDTARAQNVGPFKAIVGTGTGDSQKVTSGTVAIPWHWGNKGISQGATANFACIDAVDNNIKMPESKACLCRIHT